MVKTDMKLIELLLSVPSDFCIIAAVMLDHHLSQPAALPHMPSSVPYRSHILIAHKHDYANAIHIG
jgi:hypothetical protein